ncbi:MAG: PEP-CTERM sorting domain-containing protein [Phycisphaerales bacterium]|nr:PEP-CTERM sorting domain-containing protein [Phycisphaerales bacterium]
MKRIDQAKYAAISAVALVLGLSLQQSAALAEAWKFGVIGDTQQTKSGGLNSVATEIITAINTKFIEENVEFVLQVGDLTDNGSTAGLQTRLDINADLTAAGIRFFGLRGNHEGSSTAATFFQNNYVPSTGNGYNVSVAADNLTYSFTYNNAKFLMLDYSMTSGNATNLDTVTNWMNGQFAVNDYDHAFVLQHKNMLGQNHKDNVFGSSNDSNPTQQNNFIKAMEDGGVRYNLSGHDHVHHRAEVTSPDGQSKVTQIINASASTKFYTPRSPYSTRETVFNHELYNIGYYVYTVDGPRVTVEHFGVPHNNYNIPANPQWTLRDTFGYSLNGKQFTIARDQTYTTVTDSVAAGNGFLGTTMQILDGSNTTTVTATGSRATVDDLNTGWANAADSGFAGASDVLYLWGMANALGSDQTDTFVLSMSFDPIKTLGSLADGSTFIATQKDDGTWVNAVDLNFGGTKAFVLGAYENTYGLGTYGIDPTNNTAWAVINHNSQFGVVPEPASLALLAIGAGAMMLRRKH